MREARGGKRRSWGKGSRKNSPENGWTRHGPSNRRLDYSARRIGRVCVRVGTWVSYVHVYVYSFFLMYPSSRPGISSIFTPLSFSDSFFAFFPSSIGLSFFSSSRLVPEEQIAAPSSRVDRVRKRVSDG